MTREGGRPDNWQTMSSSEERLHRLETEIERKLLERFAALRDEFDRLRVESDQRWAGFLSRFDQDFRGFVPPELFETQPQPQPQPQPQAQASSGAAAGALPIGAARDLDEASNQVDVLHKYLELARSHASRVALLIARGDALGVWKSMGFTEHGSGNGDDVVRRVALPMSGGGPLVLVMEGTPVDLGAGSDVSRQLSSADAVQAVLIPMVVKEKVSGALYADCVAADEGRFDPGALGLLTYMAGLVVDRLATRKLKPAPALRPAEAFVPKKRETEAPLDLTPEPGAEPAAEEEFELVSEATNPPAPVPLAPSPASAPPPPPLPAPAAAAPPRVLEETAPRGARPAAPAILHFEDSSAGSGYRLSRPDVLAAAATPASSGSSAPPAATAGAGARPSLGARRLAGPLAPAEGDERREEARRFAKLLVSEIKLYNERAVIEGREKGNIYQRLKEDIDRSRQMYDERIPQDVRASSNFFVEELVRILADGRSEALGI